MTNQSNRTAVITGAGDGIGRALAINLNGRGIDLYLCDIDRERLDATAGMLNSDGVTVFDSGCRLREPRTNRDLGRT